MIQRFKAVYILVEFILTVSVVILLMTLFNKKHWHIRKAWAKLQTLLIGVKTTTEGVADLNAQMIVCNHQSLLDIVVLESIHPKNLSWVAKKEIQDLPFFGKIISLPKMIAVERENKKSLLKLFADCKNRLENERVIAIFPEGTRGDGYTMKPFKAGAKMIANKLSLKVQPVVIVNTKNILDSQGFKAQSGDVKIIYLDTVDVTADKAWFDHIQVTMQAKLTEEMKLLNA